MEARSLTVSASAKPAHRGNGCGCGCGGGTPPDVCCGLDCITAPRYFCGQLLTDQDLQALVDWTRAKGRLARYRHGWGVVCGLDVHCHPQRDGTVVVSPGYAVSCCGDDIIVCDEAELDLSAACIGGLDPCGELGTRPQAYASSAPPNATGALQQEPFDIYIAYDEQLADSRAALARAACAEAAACEHARVRETYRLTWKPGGTSDPVKAAATAWREAYRQTLEVLDAFEHEFDTIDADQATRVRAWFLSWIDRHPLHHFCRLRDRICDLDAKTLVENGTIADLLFWFVQDSRNAYLACGCYSCGPDTAVPLARVWLRAPDGSSNGGCRVTGIDPYWPFRRGIGLDCWPAPPGTVNIAQLIWHRQTEACVRLADLGVGVEGVIDWDPPEDLGELRRVLECSPFVPCGERRSMLIYDAGPLDRRVIGFCEAKLSSRPPSLTLSKTSDPEKGVPGTDVTFTFEVVNRGDQGFHVVVDDNVFGRVGETEVAAGATGTFTKLVPVAGEAGQVTNTATAVATNAGGESSATVTHTYEVVAAEEHPNLSMKIDGPSEAEPTQTVKYAVVISNPGAVELHVVADDTNGLNRMPQEARDGFDLAAGDSRTFSFDFTVPRRATGEIVEEVNAVGNTPLGAQVQRTARHVLKVTGDPPAPALEDISGLSDVRREALKRAGIDTLDQVADADAQHLADVAGGDTTEALAHRWQTTARRLLNR
jgi:hypothetical protein